MPSEDSREYREKKAFFAQMLTVYGRKPVLEALQDNTLPAYKLHLADSNRQQGIVADIHRLAEQRDIPIEIHDRRTLSRISRNSKQDQGVALDLQLPSYQSYKQLLQPGNHGRCVVALDRITNPQNLGMIIRSVSASGIQGLLLPTRGCASLSPLVAKASAGTLFKAPIYYCGSLSGALKELAHSGFALAALSSHATTSLFEFNGSSRNTVFVLGNETEGVSADVNALCTHRLAIPMHNGVESLNVAITAALIAFHAASQA